jgi:hypothetical protein
MIRYTPAFIPLYRLADEVFLLPQADRGSFAQSSENDGWKSATKRDIFVF